MLVLEEVGDEVDDIDEELGVVEEREELPALLWLPLLL